MPPPAFGRVHRPEMVVHRDKDGAMSVVATKVAKAPVERSLTL